MRPPNNSVFGLMIGVDAEAEHTPTRPAIGWPSSVRVPAVSVAVDAMRMSATLVLAWVVRNLLEPEPGRMPVPPVSLAENERATNIWNAPEPAANAVPSPMAPNSTRLIRHSDEPP